MLLTCELLIRHLPASSQVWPLSVGTFSQFEHERRKTRTRRSIPLANHVVVLIRRALAGRRTGQEEGQEEEEFSEKREGSTTTYLPSWGSKE